jgi:hypothetical protein
VYPPITELNKPRLKECKHLHVLEDVKENVVQYSSACAGNCKDYDNRPPSCAGYKCSWLQGHGDEEDRPDKCGILMDTTNNIENGLECKEIWPGAADETKGAKAIERTCSSIDKVALVISFYEPHIRKVVGTPL